MSLLMTSADASGREAVAEQVDAPGAYPRLGAATGTPVAYATRQSFVGAGELQRYAQR